MLRKYSYASYAMCECDLWIWMFGEIRSSFLQGLTFQKIQHAVTAVDCQPMFDGGILINVIGQLKVCQIDFKRLG